MVNHKKRAAKKGRTTSSVTQKRKRTAERSTVPRIHPSSSIDHEQVPVVTSLPPAVDGHLRCFLRVSVQTIHWRIPKYPSDIQVRLKWWGEEGEGVLFRPKDDKETDQTSDSRQLTCVRYAVCSGPRQFGAYLKDMGPLIFDVVHGPSLILLGHVRLEDVTQLSASDPIQGFFDVVSTTSPNDKIALLYIALRFESISAAYDQLSSAVPTVDMALPTQRRRPCDENDVQPTLPPLSLQPATPMSHPRQIAQDSHDPFVSPAPHTKGVRFALNSPEQLEYTAETSSTTGQATDEIEMEKDIVEKGKLDDTESKSLSEIPSASSHQQVHGHASVSSDLIGALLKRGEKLREAMVMSADEDNDMDELGSLGSFVERTSPPGKLFKAILTSHETEDVKPDVSGEDESALIESVFLQNNRAVDLVLGEEGTHYVMESSGSSPESSIVSEPGDPLHDDSLLKDLFYTAPAMASDTDSDNTISTDDNGDNVQDATHTTTSKLKNEQKVSRKTKGKQHFPLSISGKDPVEKSPEVSSVGYIDPKQTNGSDATEDHGGLHIPNTGNTSTDSLASAENNKESSPNPHGFIENLGPERLTALGRVDAARVIVDNLGVSGDNVKPGTYFAEYSFPSSVPSQSQEEDISIASELTRIASKKFQDAVVLFNHRSVFPVLFNSTVIDYWWRRPLTFRVYFRESGQRMPVVVGAAAFPLKTVLQSDTLSSSASLQIKHSMHSKHEESSSSSSLYHASSSDDQPCAGVSFGPLLVKVELMTDGKQLHVKPSTHRKPPHPSLATPTKTTDCIQVTKPAQMVGQVFVKAPQRTTNKSVLSHKMLPQTSPRFDNFVDPERDPLTLFMLLWIPEGKDLIQHGYHSNKGLVTKNNLYLVCRMFWGDELSKSKVCWGSANPAFGFKQVSPVLLTSSLLQRVCNNFMVIEVWNRIASHDCGDQLVGLVKLPLHQLYLSYRDPKITKTLFKSKYPVVAFDEWSAVSNPFTHLQHGHLRVLLALGLEEQIAAILTMKCGGDLPVGISFLRPDHHLDTQRMSSGDDHREGGEEFVEHQFEFTVEDIKGLSVFGHTVWGETDCFVQYHFPFQRHLQQYDSSSEAIPILQPHRTPTTLCVPDPAFHDVTRHTFKLPQGFPVQRHLLQAFTGSRLAAASAPALGGVPFELWRRYYYPNIRDQMVAKASLPLAKLCAMVTMQKHGEANMQTFSLPLTVLAGDEMDGMRLDRVQDTGLLDVTVKYQQVLSSQLRERQAAHKQGDTHVCLSLEVIQACGLKAAASLHAKSNPNLSYPAKVGVNAYIVIHFPFGKKRKQVTRTVARTFSPEFTYNADLLLPLTVTSGDGEKKQLSLAEQLEGSEMLFEVWHQMSRGVSGSLGLRSGDHGKAAREGDTLLGVGRVPLIMLLTRNTGVKGWYPIYLPTDSNVHDASSQSNPKMAIGGLELCIRFSEGEDRDHVIYISRGVGWSPPPGVECNNDWLDKDELLQERHWEFCLKISKAWIPPSELNSFNSVTKKEVRSVKAYARYKLHNKAPTCSRLSPVKDSGDDKFICELKHSKDIVLPRTPSVTWYMKEENLEIQVWLSKGKHDVDSNSSKRDRLLGSAFVDVSSLLVSQERKHRQISGLYPIFRSGASDLFGACLHVCAALKWCSEGDSDPEFDLSQDVCSDDSVYNGSPVEDSDAHTKSIKSPQDHSAKTTEHYVEQQLAVLDTDGDDTFTAHVIIEQALHLPTVPGSNNERLLPNVYVSYQTLPSAPASCTSVIESSTSPSWEYQKLERIRHSSLKSQGLEFKVCHFSGTCDEGVHTKTSTSAKGNSDSSTGNRVLGFVLFDMSPLLAGMRQLIGWYNVTDFNGDCKGQIKLGVSPVMPVSPPRSLPASRLPHLLSSQQDVQLTNSSSLTTQGEPHQIRNHQDISVHRSHTDNVMSHQLSRPQDDQTSNFKPHATITLDTDAPAPASSTSFLFSQLRHSMKELDALQQNLNVKLKSGSAAGNDTFLTQRRPSVVTPPSCLLDTGATKAISKSFETFQPTNASAEEPDFRSKTSLTELDQMEFKQGVIALNGKQSFVPDDEQLLPSPFPVDGHFDEGTGVEEDKQAEASSGKDILDVYKSKEEYLLQSVKGDSFFTLKKSTGTSSNEETDKRDIFPIDKGEKENIQPSEEVDSFFSLGRNRSSSENRQPSVDIELSVSDVSEDLSVSGYIQNNSNTVRFTDIKDSWLSSEDEDTPTSVGQSKNPGVSSSPSVFTSGGKAYGELDNAAVSLPHIGELQLGTNDEGERVDNSNKGEGGIRRSRDDNLEGITNEASVDATYERAATCRLVNGASDVQVTSFQTDQGNEYNYSVSYNKRQIRELPRKPALSGSHAGYQLTSSALPNFFMPTEQLAESMRSLRLGSSHQRYNTSHSNLLARSNYLGDQQKKGKVSERFAKQEHVYKAKRDQRPPISNSEADRIARIFSSGII